MLHTCPKAARQVINQTLITSLAMLTKAQELIQFFFLKPLLPINKQTKPIRFFQVSCNVTFWGKHFLSLLVKTYTLDVPSLRKLNLVSSSKSFGLLDNLKTFFVATVTIFSSCHQFLPTKPNNLLPMLFLLHQKAALIFKLFLELLHKSYLNF